MSEIAFEPRLTRLKRATPGESTKSSKWLLEHRMKAERLASQRLTRHLGPGYGDGGSGARDRFSSYRDVSAGLMRGGAAHEKSPGDFRSRALSSPAEQATPAYRTIIRFR